MGLVKDAMSSRRGKYNYHWTRFVISLVSTLFALTEAGKHWALTSEIELGLGLIVFFVIYLTVASWVARIWVVLAYLATGR